MITIVTILALAVVALSVAVYLLWKKVDKLDDEVLNMRYIKVEKLPDGGHRLSDRTGKLIFEI